MENYFKNLPHYVLGLNNRLMDTTTPSKNKEKYCGILANIDIYHVALVYHLYDIYSMLSKAQHGVCKVNQLPWHFNDRIDHLKSDLNTVMDDGYEGPNKEAKMKLSVGEFETGTLITTEERRVTRVTIDSSYIVDGKEKAKSTLYCFQICKCLNS